jgi:hypothetical protein
MHMTLALDARLLRSAKKRAAEEGITLGRVIEDALRRYLAAPARARQPFRLCLLTKRGRALPGVKVADRDALYTRMEGPG